jgi:glycosyltransferase involved in cell wall biosynthesis
VASWTILTCEYPPRCGGVGDYTAQVAAALASRGDEVTVFCPPQSDVPTAMSGVDVAVLHDTYGRASRDAIGRRLAGKPTTVLVEYVPTAFGLKGANLPWCNWLLDLSRRGTDVRVMFHEPYFLFGWKPLHQSPLSIVQRLMARQLLRVGSETFISTDSWRRYLSPYAARGQARRFTTLPIPSSIPRCERPQLATDRRRQLAGKSDLLAGHFGTYGTHVAPMLRDAVLSLLPQEASLTIVCAGAGSDRFVADVVAAKPELQPRLRATGRLAPADAAAVLSACDLLLQPFPDGVTTRRTSVMAGLMNGRAVLTTAGHLTESVWVETGAVSMTPAGDTHAFVTAARTLLAGRDDRNALAARGGDTYTRRFALEHTIDALRATRESAVA